MKYHSLKIVSHSCGYFPEKMAFDEAYIVINATQEEWNYLSKTGYRSFGNYLFRPVCENCHQCIPIRVEAKAFSPNRWQRKVLAKCSKIRVTIDQGHYSKEKFWIYLDHKKRFGIETNTSQESEFIQSFYHPDFPNLEFCYYLDNELIAIGIVKDFSEGLSSVYFCYSLKYAKLSLGTFSILKEIEYAQKQQKAFLYLGYYIENNHFMKYKASFYPNQILNRCGNWVPFRNLKGDKEVKQPLLYTPISTELSLQREKASGYNF